jgi:hypothetical protein
MQAKTAVIYECPSAARHQVLEASVAAAYGWDADIEDQDVLKRLLELNQERAAKQ